MKQSFLIGSFEWCPLQSSSQAMFISNHSHKIQVVKRQSFWGFRNCRLPPARSHANMSQSRANECDTASSNPSFLHLGTAAAGASAFLGVGRPVHRRMCSMTPGPYPLDASSTPLFVTTTLVLRYCQISPGGQNCPRLRTTPLSCYLDSWNLKENSQLRKDVS